jgi:serine/threonine protein kinase
MPVATPIREALGSDPEPGVVVAAIGEIAATLASLAAEGVAHRDIKPDNLFELGARWVIGDFGLVTYPERTPAPSTAASLGQSTTWPPRCARTPTGPTRDRPTCGRSRRRYGSC